MEKLLTFGISIEMGYEDRFKSYYLYEYTHIDAKQIYLYWREREREREKRERERSKDETERVKDETEKQRKI